PEHQMDVDVLLTGELGQGGMLGRARAAALLDHEPEPASVRDSPIRQPQDMKGRRKEIVRTSSSKQPGDRAIGGQGPVDKLGDYTRHGASFGLSSGGSVSTLRARFPSPLYGSRPSRARERATTR